MHKNSSSVINHSVINHSMINHAGMRREMEQRTDLQAVRLFSYTIFFLFLFLPVMAFLFFLVVGLTGGNGGPVLSGMGSFGILVSYVVYAAVLLCLYRMGALERYFRYAQMAFVVWILLGPVSQLIFRLWHGLGNRDGSRVLSVILSALPILSVMTGVFFILKGLEALCGVTGQEREKGKLKGFQKKWLLLEIVRLFYLRLGFLADFFPAAVFWGGFLLIFVVYGMIGIHIFRTAREVCQSYYLYALKSEQKLYR